MGRQGGCGGGGECKCEKLFQSKGEHNQRGQDIKEGSIDDAQTRLAPGVYCALLVTYER